MKTPLRWSALVTLAFPSPILAQSTLVVDGGQNGGFTTIQAAVHAAVDGDTILVQPSAGLASNWTLTLSKAITLLGDFPAGHAAVAGELTITGMRPGQQVAVRSFALDVTQRALGATIAVSNCAARVVIEECGLHGTDEFNRPRRPGLHALNAAQVHVHRTDLTGSRGLLADGSVVTISESSITGVSQFVQPSPPISDALEAINLSMIWISGSRVTGGLKIAPLGIDSARSIILRNATATLAATDLRGPLGQAPGLDLDAGSSARIDAATTTGAIVGVPGNVTTIETGRIIDTIHPTTPAAVLELSAAAGTLGALAISLPGQQVRTPFGSAFMLQPTIAVLSVGVTPFGSAIVVPPGAPRGFMFTVQGVVLDQGQVNLSTPLVSTLRD